MSGQLFLLRNGYSITLLFRFNGALVFFRRRIQEPTVRAIIIDLRIGTIDDLRQAFEPV